MPKVRPGKTDLSGPPQTPIDPDLDSTEELENLGDTSEDPEYDEDFSDTPEDQEDSDPTDTQENDDPKKNPTLPTIIKAATADALLSQKADETPESPFFKQAIGVMAGYGLVLGALKSFRAFRKSFAELRQELKKKEPEDSYRARVLLKLWPCVKHATAFIAYVASAVAILAAIANPYGLAISAGTLTIVTGVALGAAFISALAEKFADKKIVSAKAALAEVENHMGDSSGPSVSDHPHIKRIKELFTHFKIAHEIHGEYHKDGHKNPSAFFMKKAREHQGIVLKVAHHLGGDKYEAIAASTFKTLESIQQSDNPMYQGIAVVKTTIHNDPHGLLVTVPRLKQAALRAADLALDHLSAPPKTKPDSIRLFKDEQGRVKISIDADAVDTTLRLAMEAVAQKLGPLKLKPGRDIMQIIKAMEAAKLAEHPIDLKIDPSDIVRIDQEASEEVKKYFHALLGVSAEKFKHYVEEHANRVLGEIPEQIPNNWKSSLRPAQQT